VPVTPAPLEPLAGEERFNALDALRGIALFGVLMVNLLGFFRVSLFGEMLHLHPPSGTANLVVSTLVSRVLEFRAFALFAFTFGAGVAIEAGRARDRNHRPEVFLARRFAVLLTIGLLDMTLVSNVDILTLYAVCGLALLPLLRLPVSAMAVLGLAAIALPPLTDFGFRLPDENTLRLHAEAANQIYGHADFWTTTAFRRHETTEGILPLLAGSAQWTYGLMLLGMAAWRAGIIRHPEKFRPLLCSVATAGIAAGLFRDAKAPVALACVAVVLLWQPRPGPVGAAGRMALTNYLMQTVAFAVVFYGFGWFGKPAIAPTAAYGLVFYVVQLRFSVWWLARYRYGPFEWAWRCLSYGRRLHL
jgi:uncharacterized protein